MEVRTTWVEPPERAQGLDHLGTHAPCIDLYTRLLPGITNVTDRARYYSLYPWFVWAFDQRYRSVDSEKFEQLFRRADCLLTWIAERHSQRTGQQTDWHAVGGIGRQKLVPALNKLDAGEALRLSDYATRENNGTRYFQNRLGGLGQYYIGTLQDLRILDVSERGWIKYTKERGAVLAEAVERRVDSAKFFKVLEGDRVSLKLLDELEPFCFCRLPHSSEEHAQLADLLFERALSSDEPGGQRRQTLAFALAMVDASAGKWRVPVTLEHFQCASYGRSFGSGQLWKVPAPLEATASAWALYVRNDLLSIAAQAVFAVGLKIIDQHEQEGLRFATGHDFETWITGSALAKRVAKHFAGKSFGAITHGARSTLAPIDGWDLPDHEWACSRSILEAFKAGSDEAVLVHSLRILVALAARLTTKEAYQASPFEAGFLDNYPINLQSFTELAAGEWSELSIPRLLGWLMNRWGIEVHLSVALRKLRYNPQATFRVRPAERGLEIIDDIPPPTRTNPRVGQGLQMLRDLEAIVDGPEGSSLTAFGRRMLEEVLNGR
ncbi:hypothetical protein GCM10011487_19480 [Steroidobacter agaridevorans]|uniref:Uncharacterized protein n=1 Tax=Steroidobacter agaridevorans TaxID=2695856 RepID=A0A829YAS8_9GAMM|nr:hypothetical protein [Steroidobacter agaridevorans]GFE79948.1 hypothetical protein GCM10011487_19480 [Steroidobacter agaridevorans]